MRMKIAFIFILGCGLFLFFPSLAEKNSLLSVFRVTEEPVAITRGTYGSALTINLSFGDDEIVEWIQTTEKPYPLLFIDIDWANRFPSTVQLINEKHIPTALLGSKGIDYEEDGRLLIDQIDQFEKNFKRKPLWFRTIDEVFPPFLHTLLWEAKVNALGSSFTWKGGEIPPMIEGEIISVPHHQKDRIHLPRLKKLEETRDFQTIEEVLFGTLGKTKKIPE